MSNKEPSPGPFKSTTTKVIKLSPIEFTVTTTIDSTHVPAPECGCNGGLDIVSILQQAAQAMQPPSTTSVPEPYPQGAPAS